MDSEFSRKKLLVFGALLLVFLAIPVTVYTALHQQSTSTKAAVVPENTVIAVVNGQQITKAQIRTVAEEQYAPEAVDDQALKDALNTIEERIILDNAANELGITVDLGRIDKYKQQEMSDKEAHYAALKEQVTLKAVNSREASSVSFWNPPSARISELTVTEKADAATQITAGIPVLATAETRIKAGDTPQQVAVVILAANPELSSVLAVNGYLYSTLDEEGKAKASYPQIYEFGGSGLDDQTRDALFAQDEGGVVKTTDTGGNRGGTVFKVEVKGNINGPSTYEEWLASQKANLVKVISPL